jgi:dimethylargininase
MLALVHPPSLQLATGQRTHIAREPVDFKLAQAQHASYCRLLAACGAKVLLMDVNLDEPDGVFLEDTTIVLDEIAILCSMGTQARRREPAGIEAVLCDYREVWRIELPASIEGGDVLRIGRRLLVGQSSRTNAAGIDALSGVVEPLGYCVTAVPVHGCLHLKTACTALPDGQLLVNPDWIDAAALKGRDVIEIPVSEPWAANTLPIGQRVILPAAHLQTADLLHGLGFEPLPADISELAKAEGGVTCLSLILDGPGD